MGLESNVCRLCIVRVKWQKTDKPFDKRACFRQKDRAVPLLSVCLLGARTSGFEQTSCFYFRWYFITILNGFVSSYSVLSDTFDNVVHYTVPGADWMLWWLGRNPFTPDPAHLHLTEPGNSAQGGGRRGWADSHLSLHLHLSSHSAAGKKEECPSWYVPFHTGTWRGNEVDENTHVSVTGQPVLFRYK